VTSPRPASHDEIACEARQIHGALAGADGQASHEVLESLRVRLEDLKAAMQAAHERALRCLITA
jgi:hypothetical protein